MRIDKVKLIKTLRIIAYISVAAVIILMVWMLNSKAPYTIFLFWCIFPILILVAIPTFDRPFFSFGGSRFKPEVLLWIYPIIAGIVIALMIGFSYFKLVSDLPNLVDRNFSQLNQVNIQTIKDFGILGPSSISPWELQITTDNGTQLQALEGAFKPINPDKKYTFYYLPRTKWVMNIVDENGDSLLRNQ